MTLSLLVIVYVLIMVAVGLYASRKVKSSLDYVLAGRSLPFHMALATVFATWFGSESILGASGSFAEEGFRGVIQDPFGAGLCLIIAGLFFNTRLYKMSFLTIGDFFKARYNVIIATLISIAIIISYYGWVAAQLLALGIVIHTVIPSISLPIAITLSLFAVMAYTYFGGMMSVAVLDTIQSAVIIIGLIIVFIFAIMLAGSFGDVIANTPKEFFEVLPVNKDSLTEWLVFITALITMGLGSIPQQDIYQRAMSAKSATISKWASVFGGLLYFVIVLIPIGIVMIARQMYPDVLATNPEKLIPTLIEGMMPLWLQAVFFGALISAIVSTASGALLAPGTLLAENVVKPFVTNIQDKLRLFIIRLSVLFVGFGALFMALRDDARIFDLVESAYSVTLVGAFVPLAWGIYSHRANTLGALTSMVLGVSSWLISEHFQVETAPPVFIGFVLSILGMIVGSYIGRAIMTEEKHLEHIKKVEKILNGQHVH